MKVLVTGGRKYDNLKLIRSTLSHLRPDAVVIGEGKTDEAAMAWARWFGIPFVQYCADWKNFGNAAGPIRNQQMLEAEKPDLVVAFPGGAGTADMVKRARKVGVEVLEVTEEVKR